LTVLLLAPFATPGPRARENPIAFNKANKQIEQKLALRRLQHRQHALPTGEGFWAYAVMQALAARREVEEAGASIAPFTRRATRPFDSSRLTSKLVVLRSMPSRSQRPL
jgi:hypothetical protein